VKITSQSGFSVAYKFLPGAEHNTYSLEILYMCDTLFARPYEILLEMNIPGCGSITLKWKKVCRLLFSKHSSIRADYGTIR
jgi:hypothetical protein